MKIRTFTAASMQEALLLVQRELGDEALIIETRMVSTDTLPDEPSVERFVVKASLPGTPTTVDSREGVTPLVPEEHEASSALSEYLTGLSEEMRDVHTRMEGLATSMPWLGQGFPAQQQGDLPEYLVQGIAKKLPFSGGIQLGTTPRIVALIGPNGAGKTTMVAKIAWHFQVTQQKRVGIISTDNIKIGGASLLQVVCAHLDIPLELVYTPEALPEAIDRLADCELILIDTPGGSQRNAEHLAELRTYLHQADPAEIHLVLGVSTSPAVMREILYRTAVFQPDQVILTKLDETSALLDVLPVFFGTGLALSYLGTGPSIFSDIQIATATVLTQLFALE